MNNDGQFASNSLAGVVDGMQSQYPPNWGPANVYDYHAPAMGGDGYMHYFGQQTAPAR